MTKADEIKIRKIIQEELRKFFAKTVGLVPLENDNRKKRGIKKPKNSKDEG